MYRSIPKYSSSCYFCGVSPIEDSDFPRLGSGVATCGLCIRNFQLACINPICTSLICVAEKNWSAIRKGELVQSLCPTCDRTGFKKCVSCKKLFKRIAGNLPLHLYQISYPSTGYVTKVGNSYLCDRCIQYCDQCKAPGRCERCPNCDRLRCQKCCDIYMCLCSHHINKQAQCRKRKSITDPSTEEGQMSPEHCTDSPPYYPTG